MPRKKFSHITAWVFDLDNTLYPPRARLFDQIEQRMTRYVMTALNVDRAEADRMRRDYWRDYGTTLAGLMARHKLDPEPYLDAVHDIDLSHLEPAPALGDAIVTLSGRRIVYTNGSAPYARRVLAARGLSEVFDAVYGVEHARYRPKPEAQAFRTVFDTDGIDATQAAMFEDDARNLIAPHQMGMRTVHVAPDAAPADHIHHHTDDLTAFLQRLLP